MYGMGEQLQYNFGTKVNCMEYNVKKKNEYISNIKRRNATSLDSKSERKESQQQ